MYKNVVSCQFIKRLNRFLGLIKINHQYIEAHIPNTSRLNELLTENRYGYATEASNPNRKTKYTLISLYKNGQLFNIDSQAPNKVLEKALLKQDLAEFSAISKIKRESTYQNSRFDFSFYNEKTRKTAFLEVKGVTLEDDGYAKFPGAPTKRGVKHLKELTRSIEDGYEAYVFFLLQFRGSKGLKAYRKMDPEFADSLKVAQRAGVKIIVYDSLVNRDTIDINQAIPFIGEE